MEWIYLIFAGIFEVIFVTFMKLSNGFSRLAYSIATFTTGALSLYLLSLALLSLPVGSAYAIWTGIGAAGSVIIGMLFFKESKSWKRIVFISCILMSVIGLKVTSI